MIESVSHPRSATSWASRFWVWCLAALLVLSGCGGDGGGSDAVATTPGAVSLATVSGIVVSSTTGLPLAGVSVTTGSRVATTASDGRYTLTDVPMSDATVIGYELAGHAKGLTKPDFGVPTAATADVRLVPVGATQRFDAATAATVAIAGSSAQVSLPAGGLVTVGGTAASGTVTAELTAIAPATDPASMPGNYTASLAGGGTGTIESYGAIHVNLRDAAGNALNLASGKTATIRIPLSTRSADVPATMPLYYFNETTGLWVQEGTATLAGTAPNQYYEGTVSHFSYWNADRPAETILVKGCVKDASGAAVGLVRLRSEGTDYSGQSSALADSAGNFSLAIRKGSVAAVWGELGERSTNVLSVGPSNATITLASCLVLGSSGLAPQIVQPPVAQTVAPGSYVQFSVQAVGTAPLRYQWLRDGTAIEGATQSTYLLYGVQASDSGARLAVRVSNAIGSVTSDAVSLTVSDVALPPLITTAPLAATVALGETAFFTVSAVTQGGTLQYQWLRDGTAIAGATGASYTTPATVLADSGAVFSVRVSSSNGSSVTSATALLTVQPPAAPVITTQPRSVNVQAGLSATFSVVASGGSPSYQWRRNGADIAGATTASYTTPALALADSGAVYSVVVSNSGGSVASADATLTVVQTQSSGGYHLVAEAGASVTGTMQWASGTTNFSSAALMAVNADNPAQPGQAVVVEPAGQALVFDFFGDATVSGSLVSNARVRLQVYAKGGRFYKLDQVASGSSGPQPALLSTLTTQEVCGANGAVYRSGNLDPNDLVDPSRSWMFLEAPGADGQCGTSDDVMRAVRLNMSGSTAAQTLAAEPMAEIRNASGAITGFIVRAGTQIRQLDADLGNAVNLFTVGDTVTSLGVVFGSGAPGIWLFADGSTLYGVNLATPQTRVALATLAGGETVQQIPAGGGSEAFVAIDGASGSRVVRVTEALAGSALATFPERVTDLVLTTSRLLASGTSGKIYSLPRAGGSLDTLLTPASGEFAVLMFSGGETAVVQVYSQTGGRSVLLINGDGSNPQTLDSTAVVGALMPASMNLQSGLAQIHAVQLASPVGTDSNLSGATVRAVQVSSRAALVTYGSLSGMPAGVAYADFGALQYGQPGLLTYLDTSGAGSDLFFYDSDAAGLVRVTSTLSASAVAPGVRSQSLVRAVGASRPALGMGRAVGTSRLLGLTMRRPALAGGVAR